ncbi:hypothetical protein [Nocardia elegans]|uniref:hypothetical protein n=1 Tax=Nocardia elegans TaxID=300029 RepID=UPI001E2D47A5|nr:hypothetical protein [Nocardia elegans]
MVEGPCAALSALIESVGVVEAARAVRERELPEALRGATRARREVDRAEADLATMARLGGRVVTPEDAEWPAWRMLGLSQLAGGPDPDGAVPLVLWVRGRVRCWSPASRRWRWSVPGAAAVTATG